MTHQDILTKAIEKAIENGWLQDKKFKSFKKFAITWGMYPEDDYLSINQYYSLGELHPRTEAAFSSDYDIIFNHDFAKALWGEKQYVIKPSSEPNAEFKIPSWDAMYLGWQYHLQQMVIAEDPIQYLGDHLDN